MQYDLPDANCNTVGTILPITRWLMPCLAGVSIRLSVVWLQLHKPTTIASIFCLVIRLDL